MSNNMRIRVIHFGPKNKDGSENKDKIWVVIESKDKEYGIGGHGYINNILGIQEIDKSKDIYYPINIVQEVYMEHANGGRTNKREYASVEEYWNDHKVKELVLQKYKEGFVFQMQYMGDPDGIDVIQQFEIVGYGHEGTYFSLTDSLWDIQPPIEWYNEAFTHVIENIRDKSSYATYDDALHNLSKQEDLFGDRFFPVLKAPINLRDEMEEIAHSFKGHSKTLMDGDNIYIGLRSKPCEIYEIKEIYEKGGSILINQEWDWE